MARIIFIVFSLAIIVSCVYASDVDDNFCGNNEIWSMCGRMCEPSCKIRTPNRKLCSRIQCTNSTACCRCKDGYYRDVNGECVSAEYCSVSPSTPACGTNEQLGNCGRICERTCRNSDLSKCATTSCTGNGCQCKEGYLRNEITDKCVPASMCPDKKCKKHEIYEACGRTCEGTCQSPRQPEICSRIRCATQDCRCDLYSGYVRNTETGKCVAIKDCPNSWEQENICPSNSTQKLCGGVCEPTCADPRERLCKIDPSTCTIDCRCLKGFVRNEKSNECVKQEDCCLKKTNHESTIPESQRSTAESERIQPYKI